MKAPTTWPQDLQDKFNALKPHQQAKAVIGAATKCGLLVLPKKKPRLTVVEKTTP